VRRSDRPWRRPRASDPCYIAIKPDCGCVVEALVIRCLSRPRLQSGIGTWLSRGWLVGRVRTDEATHRLRYCACNDPRPDPAQIHLPIGATVT